MRLTEYLRVLALMAPFVLGSGLPALAQSVYAGRTSSTPFFSFTVSADGLYVAEVRVTNHSCLGALTSFTALLAPDVAPISTGSDGRRRFEARDISIPNNRTFDIVGVLFDADAADHTAEQGVGGLSMMIALGRCNANWTATANPDGDTDGWSDRAELRLGSNPGNFANSPEHGEIPAVLPFYVRPCDDLVDNDADGGIDKADQGCVVLPTELVVDFGSTHGLWIHAYGVGWRPVHPLSPQATISADLDANDVDDLVVDFGAPYGVWIWMNRATWVALTPISPTRIVAADLDGNGKDELVGDFGPPYGLWIFANNATWSQLHALGTEMVIVGDVDGNRQADLVIDFGSPGLWLFKNNATWEQLHGLSPKAISFGRPR